MRYTVILEGRRGARTELVYRLHDTPVTRRFARVTAQALAAGARPHGAYFSTLLSNSQYRRMLQKLRDLSRRVGASGLWDMPAYPLTPASVTQTQLNTLHQLFHTFEEQCAQHADTSVAHQAVRRDLNELNLLIHRVEHEVKSRADWSWQFFGCHLAPQEPLPLQADDYRLMTAQVRFGDLLLCYGTAGKNLYTCFLDDDIEVVRRGEVRQQRTVSTGVLAAFTTAKAFSSSVEYERAQDAGYRAWCRRHEVSALGHDVDLPEYRFGNIPLGELEDRTLDWNGAAAMLRSHDRIAAVRITPAPWGVLRPRTSVQTGPATHPSVADLVAWQAALRPDEPAAVDRLRRVTYAKLMGEAYRLGHHLATERFVPGDVLGLLLEPSCDLASSMLGIWSAGGIALPLDPSLPRERLRVLLSDAGCRIVITTCEHAETVQALGLRPIYLDACARWIRRQPSTRPQVPVQRLACLLYTSGSTGRPKGVALSHAALAHKLTAPGAWGAGHAGLRSLWHGSPSFDASLGQWLLPLVHGGRVRALDSQERLEPRRLWAIAQRFRANLLDCTPSWLAAMLDAAPHGTSLQRIVVGGEILTPAVARSARERFPQAVLVNAYGPTEACIDATAHEVTAQDLHAATVPIGRALTGYRVVLLDEDRRPLPADEPGSSGEIAIGGVGLADGYWQQPEASAERFIADPAQPDRRLYRSGDLGRWRADGTLEFLGRNDQQVKIRGQRVELGEIEAALARQPGVQAAVVRLWDPEGAERPVLAAYVVCNDSSLEAVKAGLRHEFPAAMLPGAWVEMEALPLLPSGKVDRARLPQPIAPRQPAAELVPGHDLQADLLALWRQILGCDCAVDDNFFDLGGDSLAAVELIEAVSRRTGVTLSLATLLAHPSVADLALVLSGGLETRCAGRVLKLGSSARDATASQLFLLPAASGVGFVYTGLARRLAPQCVCSALQVVGLDGPVGGHSMTALARWFADDLQAVQPTGDVQLAGYSAGGAIAHALTAELQRRGRRVGRLWLIDPYEIGGASAAAVRPGRAALLREYRADMLWDAFGLRGAAAQELLVASDRLIDLGLARADAPTAASDPRARRAFGAARAALPPGASLSVFLMLLEGVLNTGGAYIDYAPSPLTGFDGEVSLLQPEADDPSLRDARAACWRGLMGVPLQRLLVPGEHATLLQRAASVDGIAAEVRRTLGVLS